MPVTLAMITELSDALMKDQAILHPSFRLSNFKRQGTSADSTQHHATDNSEDEETRCVIQ